MRRLIDGALFRPTWAEVDVGHIENNARALCEAAQSKNLGLIAVVKADGYGHGAVHAGKAALRGGARMLAVALVEEGIALRQGGIAHPILVMGAYAPGTAAVYADHDLTATVTDRAQLERLAADVQEADLRPLRVHLKIDTGMGRLGVLPDEAATFAMAAADTKELVVEGAYSHLATGDEEDLTYAQEQIETFEKALEAMRSVGAQPTIRHILNTGGLLQHNPGSTNYARVGLALYGLFPSEHLRSSVALTPALTWKSRVATVKRAPKGTSVSYGRSYVTRETTRLATIPVGYADGYSRRLSQKGHALIRGRRFPVAGRVCMDQIIVDVGDSEVECGDEVVLLGRQGDEAISAEELAALLETINYEVICSISPRVPRVHV